MVDKFFIFMGIATVILLITFIVFTVLYSQDKDKTSGLKDQVLQCNSDLQDSEQQLANSEAGLRNCQRSQEQLTATLDTNFEVDTTNFTTPGFIRLNQVNDRCNYPTLTPRFAFDSKNYQDCNFAFKDKDYPRCGNLNKVKCATEDINTSGGSNTINNGDVFLFAGFVDGTTPCYYWKLVNNLNEKDYIFDVVLSYFTDSRYEEIIYTSQKGDPVIIDSSVTKSTKNVDSCVPSNIRVKVTLNGVVGTIMEGKSDFYVLPAPTQNFVMSLWYNEDIASPSLAVGYVIPGH